MPNKYFYINRKESKKVLKDKKLNLKYCRICHSESGFKPIKRSKLREKIGQKLIRCKTCKSLFVIQVEKEPELKLIPENERKDYWNYLDDLKKQSSILKIDV